MHKDQVSNSIQITKEIECIKVNMICKTKIKIKI